MSHSCILIRHHITVFAFEIGAGPQPSTQVEYDDDQTKQKSLVAFLCRFDGLPSCALRLGIRQVGGTPKAA